MLRLPCNPDRRALPKGWITRYDDKHSAWYYVDTRADPPRSSWVHPRGPPAGVAPQPTHTTHSTRTTGITHNVSETEMPSTPHELWCLVEGEEIPFSVIASPTITIDGLKTMIKKRIKTDLAAYRLILWKPREVIPVKPSDTLAQRLEALGDFFQFAGKVDPVDRVSHVFQTQAPTSPHLDVLVQVPTLNDHDPPWTPLC